MFRDDERTRVIEEVGGLARLGSLAAELASEAGGERVMLVSDPGVAAAGHADRAAEVMRAAGLEVALHVDVAENLAIERACQLFDCGFANVQPHSGAQANQAVFMALMQPGDTFLGMDLSSGGHLTHGAKVNQSGKWFNAVHYGVRTQDSRLDYDDVAAKAEEHKPD